MKKLFVLAGFILFVGGFKPVFADPIFAQPGYDHVHYTHITSTGMTNVTLSRRAHKFEIVQVSTHTVFIHPYSVLVDSTTTAGQVSAALSVNYQTGTETSTSRWLESGTANTRTTLDVMTDNYCVYVSTEGVPDNSDITVDIDIWEWGW